MSDTPETDFVYENAIISAATGDFLPIATAMLKQAKKMERERDEAFGALAAQDKKMEVAGKQCGIPFEVFGCDWPDRVAEELIAVAKERDEAREALRVLFDDYKQLADSGDAGFWELEDKPAAQPALRILQQREAAK